MQRPPEVGPRALDPELRLQYAREVAWRALGRRERTAAELHRILAGKRVEPVLVERVVGELVDQGYVDDAAYARRFAEDRRRLDAWGAGRIEQRLRAAGVAPEHVAAAIDHLRTGLDAAALDHPRTGLDAASDPPDSELAAAMALLHRRVPHPPQTRRERDRALGLLLRKGYEVDLAYDAVRRHAGADEAF